MSEEKEWKELEMYCAELHDLGMRDEAKTISEEDSEYEYKKWTDYLKELLASKDKEIKSLESRLKEAEADLNLMTKTANAEADHADELLAENKSLQKRLSHLMDVAKKLANWINSEVNYRDGQYCNSKLGNALLAEWNGIKEGGK